MERHLFDKNVTDKESIIMQVTADNQI